MTTVGTPRGANSRAVGAAQEGCPGWTRVVFKGREHTPMGIITFVRVEDVAVNVYRAQSTSTYIAAFRVSDLQLI